MILPSPNSTLPKPAAEFLADMGKLLAETKPLQVESPSTRKHHYYNKVNADKFAAVIMLWKSAGCTDKVLVAENIKKGLDVSTLQQMCSFARSFIKDNLSLYPVIADVINDLEIRKEGILGVRLTLSAAQSTAIDWTAALTEPTTATLSTIGQDAPLPTVIAESDGTRAAKAVSQYLLTNCKDRFSLTGLNLSEPEIANLKTIVEPYLKSYTFIITSKKVIGMNDSALSS